MKQLLVLFSAAILAVQAPAADVGVSIQVGQPGFYGRIDIGSTAPPPVIMAEPVWVQRATVRPAPIYLRVPPGHEKHWDKHCREYKACGVPVYFVREDWYQERYSRHDDDHRDDGPGKGKGKSHGKGHGKDKDRD